MGAIRIANCNLHNQSVGEGISAAIQDLQLRQYVEQVNSCRTGLQPILRRACWLEAGSVNLGLITADIALAADHPSKHAVQRHFLETHDNRTKRWAMQSREVHLRGIFVNFAFTEIQCGHVYGLFSALLPFVGCGFCGLMIIWEIREARTSVAVSVVVASLVAP